MADRAWLSPLFDAWTRFRIPSPDLSLPALTDSRTSDLSSPTGPGSQWPNTLNLTGSGCIPTNGLCQTQTRWRLISNSDKSVRKITAVTASRAEKLELEPDRLQLWRVG